MYKHSLLVVFLFHCFIVATTANNYDYILLAEPINFVRHPDSLATTLGSNVSFECVSNITLDSLRPYPENTPQLFWRFNGSSPPLYPVTYPSHWKVSSTERSSQLYISNVADSDVGYYECFVGDGNVDGNFNQTTVTKRAWLCISGEHSCLMSANVTTPSIIQVSREVWGVPGLSRYKVVEFLCTSSVPYNTLYWYKNGENITEFIDSNTGRLTYGKNTDSYLVYGIYQCFIENSAGSADYINIRVLPDTFSNPPTNLSCYVDNDGNSLSIAMTWGPPSLLVSFNTIEYRVQITINSSVYETSTTTDQHYEMNTPTNGSFLCEVYVLYPDGPGRDGGVASTTSIVRRVHNTSTDTPIENAADPSIETTPPENVETTPTESKETTPTESIVTTPTESIVTTPTWSEKGDVAPGVHHALWVVLSIILFFLFACGLTIFMRWMFFDCRRQQQVRDREKLHHFASIVEQQIDNQKYPTVGLDYPAILQRRSDSIDTQLDEMFSQEHASQLYTSYSAPSLDLSLNLDPNVSFLYNDNLTNQEKSLSSTDTQLQPLSSTDTQLQSLSSTDTELQSLSSTDTQLQPLSSTDTQLQSLSSTDTQLQPLSSTDTQLQPLSSTDTQLQGKTDSVTSSLQPPTHSNNLLHYSNALDNHAMFTSAGNYSDSVDERDYIQVADLPYLP